MRMQKPHSTEGRELKAVDVDLCWHCRPAPRLEPKMIYYFLNDPEDPEQIIDVVEYKIQHVVDERDWADAELGVAGKMYIVDVVANENSTVRTVLWFDEEKWLVEAKTKK